ncbi:hypothetical protein [Amycolatopsis sp. cmx-4-54]|uniref:hypothetical protein n=1 Tax=Amycolatopsis sp. cmx-4-54 TaxID=2790936 RepID=UPI00397B50E9
MNDIPPDLQRPHRTEVHNKHREDPITDPAELATFADQDPDATNNGLADAYIDLGPADAAVDTGDAGPVDVSPE